MSYATVYSMFFLLVFFILMIGEAEASMVKKNGNVNNRNDLLQSADDTSDLDLAAMMKTAMIHQSEMFSQAIDFVDSLQNSPSCARIATAALITSCSSLGGAHHGPVADRDISAIDLDDIKSAYAARLAVCELLEAEIAIPTSCSSLMPSDLSDRKGSLFWRQSRPKKGSEIALSTVDVSKDQLTRCLQTLESKPQWWTSYSNGRQNAFILCQAARSEKQREELLNLHKTVTEVASNLSSTLAQSLQDSHSHLLNQNSFARSIATYTDGLLLTLTIAKADMANFLSSIKENFESTAAVLLEKVTMAADHTDLELTRFRNELVVAKHNMHEMHQDVAKQSHDILESQTASWAVQQGMAGEAQRSLEHIQGPGMDALLKSAADLQSNIQISTHGIDRISQSHEGIEERVQKLDNIFNTLWQTALAIQATQQLYAENQNHLLRSLHANIQSSNGLIDQTTLRVLELQLAVDDTTSKIKELGSLGILGGHLGPWLFFLALITCVALIDKRLASVLATGLCTMIGINVFGLPQSIQIVASSMRRSAAFLSPIHISPLTLVVFKMAVLGGVIVALCYCVSSKSRRYFVLGSRKTGSLSRTIGTETGVSQSCV
ncbi:MAG: hypothetical protein M1833_003103 [Piccolia ochrophora]|nr:MAG: hypothetical protein M1833_003103 [Piccolia ochrophora]